MPNSKITLAVGQIWRSGKPESKRGRTAESREILRYPVAYTPPWVWVDYIAPGEPDKLNYKRCTERSFKQWVSKYAARLRAPART